VNDFAAFVLLWPEAATRANIFKRWFRSVLAGVMLAALYVLGKSVAAGTFGARRRQWLSWFHGSWNPRK
jgi:hypothetical protein